jgi:hypothetical protein
MVQTAANVVERVLPPDVPLRQFVVTFPYELRGRLGFDSKLLSAVSAIVVDCVLSFYERRMRDVIGPPQFEHWMSMSKLRFRSSRQGLQVERGLCSLSPSASAAVGDWRDAWSRSRACLAARRGKSRRTVVREHLVADALNQIGRGLHHASPGAAGTEAPSALARQRDHLRA